VSSIIFDWSICGQVSYTAAPKKSYGETSKIPILTFY